MLPQSNRLLAITKYLSKNNTVFCRTDTLARSWEGDGQKCPSYGVVFGQVLRVNVVRRALLMDFTIDGQECPSYGPDESMTKNSNTNTLPDAAANCVDAVVTERGAQATDGISRAAAGASQPGRRIRVCHVSMCLLTGGLERLLVDFSRLHDADQFELQFVALGELGQPADEIQAAGCRVHSMQHADISRLQQLMRLKQLLVDSEIDVVHTHNTYAHFYGALAAKLAGVPVVINTQHGRGCGSTWKARMQFRIANRMTNRVLGVSEDAARMCGDQDKGSRGKIEAIWNGIDVDKFVFRGPVDQPVAISVARLSPEKDYPTLLRAVALAIQEVPDFRLRLVGDGQERLRLEQLAAELNIADHVEFLGEQRDIPDLLATAGFFVSSSLTEGISLTLLEAMAVGLPVLTTAVGGNPEIVVEGKTGRMVPSADVELLAQAIVEMCRDREAWPVMGQLGRQRVEQQFEIRKMVQQYQDLYRELVPQRELA